MVEILFIIFDASIGMDINPSFCFTSRGFNNYVRKDKEKNEQNPSPLQSKMAQMGVENDVTIHFTSYRSFFESYKIIFANLVMYYMKKGGFSTISCPILIIKFSFSMHTCT
jgi:hypothetical protein